MNLSARWIAFFLSSFITALTVAFLNFVPGTSAEMLVVTGISCFLSTYLASFYSVDVLIFQEVDKIYKTVKKLKIKDFNIKKKSLFKSENPLKLLNSEISDYVTEKQKEIDELKRMESFRREFLADVSHELKTPIFAAQGFVHTLLDGAMDDPEVATRFLKKAAKSLDGLDALVRDLVVLSQVETGELKMQFEIVDLVQITNEIFDQLEDKAKKRKTTLKIKPEKQANCLIVADPQRIYQVLINFIDNAIKYGKQSGKVTVAFEETKKHYTIAVEDDGPGIPKEDLGRIFERFYRVDKSRSRETGGTGLGLAIVKHILSAHNSSVTVSSKPNKGTRFSFTLLKAN